MRINERLPPNCIGHTLHRIGILSDEYYVDPGDMPELYELEIATEPSSIYGVLILDEWDRWLLIHSMLIDPHTNMVFQRPGAGEAEEVVPLDEALEPYSPSHGFDPETTHFRYLRKL